MIVFPNAKINLGLNILGKREDGFHEIVTCLYPIPLTDVLEMVPSLSDEITLTGLNVGGHPEDNLVYRAYKLLKSHLDVPSTSFHLHKVIPVGAGLGGGSSDAAYVLLGMNTLFKLSIEHNQLLDLAAALGNDVPFFVANQSAIATGTGKEIRPFTADLANYKLLLAVPPVEISTPLAYGKAYERMGPITKPPSLQHCLEKDVGEWNDCLNNDFESWVFEAYPEVGQIKSALEKAGAVYTSLSGSGAAVYGIFKKEVPPISFPKDHFVWSCTLAT